MTISTDNLFELNEFRQFGAQWTFLSDPRRVVQKDLDIEERSRFYPYHADTRIGCKGTNGHPAAA